MDGFMDQVPAERLDCVAHPVAATARALPLGGPDLLQSLGRRHRSSSEFVCDPAGRLLAVPSRDHGLVLVPVREDRIVPCEHELHAGIAQHKQVPDVAGVLHCRPGTRVRARGRVRDRSQGAIAELSAALPAIIMALGKKKVACIKAKADAKVALEGERRRTILVKAGLEGNLDAVLSLLKLQVLDAQVLTRPRLSEDMLRELLPDPRTPHKGDSKLAAVQPREPGTTARHAKQDTQPTLSLPIDAQRGHSRPQVAEHL